MRKKGFARQGNHQQRMKETKRERQTVLFFSRFDPRCFLFHSLSLLLTQMTIIALDEIVKTEKVRYISKRRNGTTRK